MNATGGDKQGSMREHELEVEVARLTAELETLKGDAEPTDIAARFLTMAASTVDQAMADARREADELAIEVSAAAEARRDEATRLAEAAEARAAALRDEAESHEASVEAARQEAESIKAEAASLKAEAEATVAAERVRVAEEVERLSSVRSALETERGALETYHDELKRRVQELAESMVQFMTTEPPLASITAIDGLAAAAIGPADEAVAAAFAPSTETVADTASDAEAVAEFAAEPTDEGTVEPGITHAVAEEVVPFDTDLAVAEDAAEEDAEAIVVAEAMPEPDVEPEAIVVAEPMPEPDVEPEAVAEAAPDIEPEVTAEVAPDIEPEVTAEVAPDIEPEVTAEVAPDVEPEAAVAEADAEAVNPFEPTTLRPASSEPATPFEPSAKNLFGAARPTEPVTTPPPVPPIEAPSFEMAPPAYQPDAIDETPTDAPAEAPAADGGLFARASAATEGDTEVSGPVPTFTQMLAGEAPAPAPAPAASEFDGVPVVESPSELPMRRKRGGLFARARSLDDGESGSTSSATSTNGLFGPQASRLIEQTSPEDLAAALTDDSDADARFRSFIDGDDSDASRDWLLDPEA